jgi:hypothetical protein
MAELYSRKYDRIFLSFDHLLDDTDSYLTNLAKFIGVDLTDDMLNGINIFLEKDFKHINFPLKDFSKQMPKGVIETINLLQKSNFQEVSHLDKLRLEFQHSLNLYHYGELKEDAKKIITQQNQLSELNQHVASLNTLLVSSNLARKLSDKNTIDLSTDLNFAKKNIISIEEQLKSQKQLLSQKQQELDDLDNIIKDKSSSLQNQFIETRQNINATIDKFTKNTESSINALSTAKSRIEQNQQQYFSLYRYHLFTKLINENVSNLNYLNPLFIIKTLIQFNKYKRHLQHIENSFSKANWKIVKHFNSEEYLKQNSDVNKAIEQGVFKNAIEHFVFFGYEEIKSGGRIIYKKSKPFHPLEIDYDSLDKIYMCYLLSENEKIISPVETNEEINIDLSKLETLIFQ